MNWKKGATSIEADGVAEGFKKSVELHGVKFSKLIGNNIKYKFILSLLIKSGYKIITYILNVQCNT